MSDQPIKTPFDFALDEFATPDARHLVLKTMHAVIVHCMTQAAIEGGPDLAAQCSCFAKMLRQIEVHLPKHSSIPLPKRTVYTAPLPQANGQ